MQVEMSKNGGVWGSLNMGMGNPYDEDNVCKIIRGSRMDVQLTKDLHHAVGEVIIF